MIAVPGDTAVTTPCSVTVTIDVSELLQLTVWFSVVSYGKTVATKLSLYPFSIIKMFLSK